MTKPLPIAVISPHGGLEIPPELTDRIILSKEAIFNEADAYVDELFDFGDRVLYFETFPYARAIIDVNRALDSTLTRPGDGIIKWRTSYGASVYKDNDFPNAGLSQLLLRKYWYPWHDKLAAIAADERVKVVLDVHTMAGVGPSAYDDPSLYRPRIAVGNMGNEEGYPLRPDFPTTSSPAHIHYLAELFREAFEDAPTLHPTGPTTLVNFPYRGGWDMRQHGGMRQPWFMIEISRALYIGKQDSESPVVSCHEAIITDLRDRTWQVIEKFVRTAILA